MTWKKSSLKLFNIHYFLLLLKRYLWLIYVPLGIYFAFLFLFLVLSIDPSAIGVFLFPYAVIAVPATALLIFHYYTKKGEVSHIFSIPLTRTEHFITTYVAGLVLILVPVMLLSIFIGILAHFGTAGYFRFLWVMFSLSIIYYSFSTLGCMLGGTVLTQMMMILVVSFGPLMLYLLINLCVEFLAFGNLNSTINRSVIAIFCPFLSAFHFADAGIWDQWFFHLFEMIVIIGICFYLTKIRPLELSGQPVVFKKAQDYLMKPVFYLNIVFLVFYFCSTMVFRDTDFSTKYYLKLVALLFGTGFIVAFMMNVWFSRDMKSLLSPSTMIQSLILTLISCFFFFVPLWQKERSRILDADAKTELNICFSGFSGYSCYGYSTLDDKSPITNENISEILHYIDEHRELFVKGPYYGIEEACQLHFWFEDSKNNQSYYIYPKNLDGKLSELVNETFLAARNEELGYFKARGMYYQDVSQGIIYTTESYVAAIESTFGKLPTDFILGKDATNNEYFNGDTYNFSESFYEKYHASLNVSSYEEWTQFIMQNADIIVDEATWTEIIEYIESLYGTAVFDLMSSDALPQYQNLSISYMDQSDWNFIEVRKDMIQAEIPMALAVEKDMELNGYRFVADTEVGICFTVEFVKENDNWQMHIKQMKEVNYY